MLFSSVTFIAFFLPITLLLYYYCSSIKSRNIVLLFVSILFYAWGEPKFVLLMMVSILVNFKAGVLLGAGRDEAVYKYRKLVLAIAVVLNVAFLFYFKYFGFATEITNKILGLFNAESLPVKEILLPLGISFYTFHSLSYIIDVYRQPEMAQKSVLNLGLYITFFPQLIAGPIVRYHDVNIQYSQRTHTLIKFTDGVQRFIIGLAKKILIANVMGKIADGLFALPFNQVSTYYTWIAVLAYALQIYYDFSGYSDMAIGLGKMFGIEFLENFNYPYAANSITDFWRRWHISLSNWFKDYLYIPLGGNRKGHTRQMQNLFIVFFTTGLWHGASLNFILWGLGHGTASVVEKSVKKRFTFKENVLNAVLAHIYTLSVVVLLWVFFRLGIRDSLHAILKMFGFSHLPWHGNLTQISNSPYISLLVNFKFYFIFFLGILFAFPWWRKPISKVKGIVNPFAFALVKYLLIFVLFILSFANIATNAYNPFIYFRF